MLVSLSPRATQQILLRSCAVAAPRSARAGLQVLWKTASRQSNNATTTNSSCLASTTTTTARLFYSTCTQAQSSAAAVLPSGRHPQHRRPTVRGKPVAFHVNDLDPASSTGSVGNNRHNKAASRPLGHHAPAAAELNYDDDDLDEDEQDMDDFFDTDASVIRRRNNSTLKRVPLPARKYDNDMIVVLDMDECLIHSQFLTNNPGAKFYAHQVARNSKDTTKGSDGTKVETFRFHLPDGDEVKVHMRPFLEEFLQAVTAKYETHIYTAAMKVYAEPILNMLDPDGDRFAQRWYRESCDLDKTMGAYVKNLSNLDLKLKLKDDSSSSSDTKEATATANMNSSPGNGMSYEEYLASTNNSSSSSSKQPPSGTTKDQLGHLRRVVLVDNNPLSFLANPTNGILVSSFYNDPADKTLPAVLDLLAELEPLEDVRPTLDSRFGLKAALSEIQGNKRQQQQQKWTAPSNNSNANAKQ